MLHDNKEQMKRNRKQFSKGYLISYVEGQSNYIQLNNDCISNLTKKEYKKMAKVLSFEYILIMLRVSIRICDLYNYFPEKRTKTRGGGTWRGVGVRMSTIINI